MSGTQTLIAVLVLGGGALAVVFALMNAALRRRRSGEFKFSIANIFSAELSLPADEKAKAVDAIVAAAKFKGHPSDAAASHVRSQVSSLDQVTIRRALWVDDKPDNNLYETMALVHLGVFVISATSNDAARRYLAGVRFDLVITDLGRQGTEDNGFVLVNELHANRPDLPVVVYTLDAALHRTELQRAGAYAIQDEPAALIDAVLDALSRSR
jgi:CheY-like chemotaxis protein